VNISKRPLKILSAIGILAALANAADYSSWGKYRPVALSTAGMGLSASVANYPVSVRFKASVHKDMLDSAATQVQADGSDIRVTLADGTTDVPFEIEHLSRGPGGRLHLWVLASNVAANSASAATFRVYWGKTGVTTMSRPMAAFPTSAGFQAVFHMNDSGSVIRNAADTSLKGSAFGTSVTTGQTAGQGFVSAKSGLYVRTFGNSNGGEDNAAATANYIKFVPPSGHILNSHTGPITMEGWVYSSITNSGNSSQGTKHIVAHGAGNTGGSHWFARTAALDGASGQNHYSAGGPNNIQGPIAPFAEQNYWQYVAASYNNGNWTIYRQREIDPWNNAFISGPPGMVPDSVHYKTIPGTVPTASDRPWYIGGAATGMTTSATDTVVTRGWQGWMDEVRISTVARDSNYVKLNFLTVRPDSMSGIIHPVSIGASEVPGAVGNYGAWAGHRSIPVNTTASGANVAAEVYNFPVLIRLGTAEASIIAAANGGNSIRFSKADNTTALPYQIESWSSSAAAIWVKLDTVKANSSTQVIRMHWDNSSATSESNGSAVFDTANGFVSVWHMNGTTTETSATAHAYVATPFNTPGTGTGAIGPNRTFSGTSYFQALGTANSAMNFAAESSYTLSAWVRADSIVTTGNNTGHGIVTKGDHQWVLAIFGATAPNRYYEITTRAANGWRQTTTRPRSYSPAYAGDTANSKVGVWRYVVGTWNGSNTSAANGRIYMDGVLQFDTTFNISTNINTGRQTARDVHIGVLSNETNTSTNATGTLERFFKGALDEIVISRGVRDANWVKLSYQNQKPANSLVGIGQPVITVPGQPTGVVATADTARARISWTAPTDNGGSPILVYKAMVVGDTLSFCESASSPCTITGLTAGTTYNVVVRAANAVGGGPNSLASNPVVPLAPVVPTAPRSPVAVVNSFSAITVTWQRPVYNGGSPITGYTVTSAPGGLTCATTGDTTCQVTGLNQATAYTFTVTASNVAGNSPPSAASTAVTTTGIVPGSFVIHMDGARNPYTFRLPVANVAITEKLTMVISDVKGQRVWSGSVNPAATKINEITWNGMTSKGHAVAPGLYVVNVKAEMQGSTINVIKAGIKQ
jgi:hypothetical protein